MADANGSFVSSRERVPRTRSDARDNNVPAARQGLSVIRTDGQDCGLRARAILTEANRAGESGSDNGRLINCSSECQYDQARAWKVKVKLKKIINAAIQVHVQ